MHVTQDAQVISLTLKDIDLTFSSLVLWVASGMATATLPKFPNKGSSSQLFPSFTVYPNHLASNSWNKTIPSRDDASNSEVKWVIRKTWNSNVTVKRVIRITKHLQNHKLTYFNLAPVLSHYQISHISHIRIKCWIVLFGISYPGAFIFAIVLHNRQRKDQSHKKKETFTSSALWGLHTVIWDM